MKRFHFLDSMRGLAALSVVLSHYCGAYGMPIATNLMSNTFFHFWWDGFAAVSFFFVLSGFVLSFASIAEGKSKVTTLRAWVSYAIMRVCRLHFTLFAVMLISLLCISWRGASITTQPLAGTWILSFWDHPPTFLEFIVNASLISYRVNILVPQSWTLSVEFLLSLFVPFGVLLAQANIWLFLVAMGLGLLRFSFQRFLFHFSLGIALATFFCRMDRKSFMAGPFACFLYGLFGFLFYTCRFWHKDLLAEEVIWYLTGFGSALLILSVLLSPLLQRVLQIRPLQVLGRISYSLYLWHIAVIICITPRILALLNALDIAGTAAWIAGIFLTVVASIVISILSERLIERPGILFGKKLRYLFESKCP